MSKSKKGSSDGRLVGWLVSFEDDQMGLAHEIRSGRTLISSDQLNGQRIIKVTEGSVSTPHSAFQASKSHKVLLQDIFSEGGTFLQRNGNGSEEKVSQPVELSHGDTIRFGKQKRFQLCLIDAPKGS